MKKLLMFVLLIVSFMIGACASDAEDEETSHLPPGSGVDKTIVQVEAYPDLPEGYTYFDYESHAEAYKAFAFAFASNEEAHTPSYNPDDQSTWTPAGFWVDPRREVEDSDPLVSGYLKRSFGLPTYLGDNRVVSTGSEPITNIPSVLGSAYAGIDMSSQVYHGTEYDFLEMVQRHYDTGSKLVHNGDTQGQSFWYDIFPQIMFARLYHTHEDTPHMAQMVINGADEWLEALPNMTKEGEPNYEFVGYNVVLESPTLVGDHIEPPNGGLAFLFYSAYLITDDEAYLEGVREVLDYLQSYEKNPNYEALTDYAPYVAAIMNAKHGADYDIGKFLDFLYEEDSAFRPGWAVMEGEFNGYPVNGLVGQSGDYAFSMNSFHLASTLAPMVKYDARYASAVGKHILNLTDSARAFFPNEIPLERQTMPNHLAFNFDDGLIYEGYRSSYGGVNGLAMGDATTMFSQPSDLSFYSSAFIGALGGMVSPTDQHGILNIDLDRTDSLNKDPFKWTLMYNPHDADKVVTYEGGGSESYSLFDSRSNSVIASDVSGDVNVDVPAKRALVLVEMEGDPVYESRSDGIYVDESLVGRKTAAVNIHGISNRQSLNESDSIPLSYAAPAGDTVETMIITFGDIEVYRGDPLESYSYDKSQLPDTDYRLRVEIETEDGLRDYATKPVVCR